jgi:phosphomethylpyrimidine synthase
VADINSKLDIGVTTGPIRGSRKIHVPVPGTDIRVAMREVTLEPGSGEAPVRVYDTSGPYTDPRVTIDIKAGLAPCAATGSSRAAMSRITQPAR